MHQAGGEGVGEEGVGAEAEDVLRDHGPVLHVVLPHPIPGPAHGAASTTGGGGSGGKKSWGWVGGGGCGGGFWGG